MFGVEAGDHGAAVTERTSSPSDLGEEDGGLCGFALGEEDAVLAVRVGPVPEQLGRRRGRSGEA